MKNVKSILIKCIYSASTLILTKQIASPSCTLYEHLDNGYSITLQNGQSINNVSGYMIERRSWHGYLGGWRGRDRSFNDTASSARIKEGCVLEAAEHQNFGGKRRSFDNPHRSGVSSQYYNLHDHNFGDMVTSARCDCPQVYTEPPNPINPPNPPENGFFPVFPANYYTKIHF